MPIYEYECANCNYKFERLQKVSDGALSLCPNCGREQLKKLISNTSFQLKGTGWYVTDFKEKRGAEIAGKAATPEKKEINDKK